MLPVNIIINDPIHFHEDFYCQVELIPVENYFKVKNQFGMVEIDDDDLLGFNQCIEREATTISVSEKKIISTDINNALRPLAISYSNKLSSGYGSTSYFIKDPDVWGFERHGLVIEKNISFVSKIWLLRHAVFNTKTEFCPRLREALLYLISKHNLIMVDWNNELVIRFNKNDLDNYLSNQLGFDFS